LAITEPFVNRFGSNLNRMHKINCKNIKINKFQNSSESSGQDGGSKLSLAITEPFMNGSGSNSNCMRKILCQNKKFMF